MSCSKRTAPSLALPLEVGATEIDERRNPSRPPDEPPRAATRPPEGGDHGLGSHQLSVMRAWVRLARADIALGQHMHARFEVAVAHQFRDSSDDRPSLVWPQPREDHHPPAAGGGRQNASVQRPGVEPGASRHPGPAAGHAPPTWPPSAQSRPPDPEDAAADPSHMRRQRPRKAQPRLAVVRLRRCAAPPGAGGAGGTDQLRVSVHPCPLAIIFRTRPCCRTAPGPSSGSRSSR
jgi:hypothetical protein